MPGNLRRKLKQGGPTERDYLRARRSVLRDSPVCKLCWEAIDLTLRPICCKVDASGFTVENAHEIPLVCGEDCGHPRKPNPWSGSADHVVAVEKLPPGSPLLTSKRGLQASHLLCNQRKGNRDDFVPRDRYMSSGDWF